MAVASMANPFRHDSVTAPPGRTTAWPSAGGGVAGPAAGPSYRPRMATIRDPEDELRWIDNIPFWGVHLVALVGAIWVGISWAAIT